MLTGFGVLHMKDSYISTFSSGGFHQLFLYKHYRHSNSLHDAPGVGQHIPSFFVWTIFFCTPLWPFLYSLGPCLLLRSFLILSQCSHSPQQTYSSCCQQVSVLSLGRAVSLHTVCLYKIKELRQRGTGSRTWM